MRRIFAIGEMVLDIIFKGGKPVSATPGGSMLNTAVSLGRLGLEAYFISEFGKDKVGDIADAFLTENGINTRYTYRYPGSPSSLALAFLNEHNNADYQFYKQYPEKRLDITFPEPTEGDVILFGSFYGIDPNIHLRLKPFLQQAKEKNALIIYDPNFRTTHLPQLEAYRPVILENFGIADIVKGSDEDFGYIFNTGNVEDTWEKIKGSSDALIYTANKNDVKYHSSEVHETYEVPAIHPISTIGAGDSFNAGLIYGLISQGITKNNLKTMDHGQRSDIIRNAIRFAGHVCMSYDNYISQAFADEIKSQA
ncbi:MAG: carbohydrate kinase [Bacteroidales bacterium]|jgi:fructokinase|nr:carbohydrate kinase [Bacteroidales bacterium]